MRDKKQYSIAFYITVIVHIVLSFVWERLVFINVGVNPSGTKALSGGISDLAEGAIAFALTHLFAALIIYCLWKLIFYVFSDFKKEYTLFLVLFVLGSVALTFLWPEIFTGLDGYDDNLVTYSCGVRLTPDYWHNAYSSIIYAAMLLVVPVNPAISLLQWAMLVYVLAYLFFRLNSRRAKAGYWVFILFLLPSTLYLAANGHRMYQFTLLVILYTAIIVTDIYAQKERTSFEYVKMAALGAFISVFRSEGIIIGVLLYGIYLLFGPERKASKVVARIVIFAVIFVVLYLPNSIGTAKYYGKDYSMINTFDVLRYILNDKECSLEYEGAEADIAALEAVVPVKVIKSGGTDGYRRYNYNVRGNADINQSYVDSKVGAEYMNAYHNLVKHNLKLYFETQINASSSAMGLGYVFPSKKNIGGDEILDDWYYIGWENGIKDFYDGNLIQKWYYNSFRKGATKQILGFWEKYIDFVKHRWLYFGGVLFLVLTGGALCVRGIIEYFKRKDRIKLAVGYIGLTGVLSLLAVCVVMPTSASIYFVGSTYLLITLVIVALCYEADEGKLKKQLKMDKE